jgi:hypothetical protein
VNAKYRKALELRFEHTDIIVQAEEIPEEIPENTPEPEEES